MYMAALQGLYDEMMCHDAIQSNPWRHPLVKLPRGSKAPRNIPKEMTAEEASLLLSIPDQSTLRGIGDYALLSLLLGGGLRRMEVLNLKREDVDINSDGITVIKLYDTKAAKFHAHSLPQWAADGVWRWIDTLVGRDVLLFDVGRTWFDEWFQGMLKRAELGGKGYTLRSCRVTGINTLLRMGHSHREVQKFSRHASVRMVEVYERRLNNVRENPGLTLIYGGKYGGAAQQSKIRRA